VVSCGMNLQLLAASCGAVRNQGGVCLFLGLTMSLHWRDFGSALVLGLTMSLNWSDFGSALVLPCLLIAVGLSGRLPWRSFELGLRQGLELFSSLDAACGKEQRDLQDAP